MSAMKRNLTKYIERDLEEKFVFLSGPRQVGKTTLAREIIGLKKGTYLLYDDDDDRRTIFEKGFVHSPFVCLDEFHKYERWKSFIKGIYDKYHENLKLILTGSARLDVYQRTGDSLFGRYYLYHLHPISAGELANADSVKFLEDLHLAHPPLKGIEELLNFGGFPEPFSKQSIKEHRRWSNSRRNLLVREELRGITEIKMLGLVEQLMLLLPERIGSLFSYRSVSEIIKVSVPTIQNWLSVFEKLFVVFKISPYSARISRSLQKQPKYYLWDWSQISDPGSRYENFIASHLWKAASLWTDLGEGNVDLFYIRDRDGREVDFMLTKDNKPWFLVEAKLSDSRISDSLKFFSNRLGIPGIQLMLSGGTSRKEGNISVIDSSRWLGNLP